GCPLHLSLGLKTPFKVTSSIYPVLGIKRRYNTLALPNTTLLVPIRSFLTSFVFPFPEPSPNHTSCAYPQSKTSHLSFPCTCLLFTKVNARHYPSITFR